MTSIPASMPWIRLYTEMLDDPKLGRLPDATKWRMCQLFLFAGECDAEGYLVNGKDSLTVEDIAWRLRINSDELQSDLDLLTGMGIIDCEDGTWMIVKFSERQPRPQSEKRKAWRERKRRQREQDPDTSGTSEDVTRESRVTHAGVTPTEERRVEKSRGEESISIAANAAPPQQPPPKTTKPTPKTAYTEGQRGFLEKHGAKRFKNLTQAEAVLGLEQKHGTRLLLEGATWSAKCGMTLGKAVLSLETALPKWGEPKSRGSPGDLPEAKSAAVIRAWAKEQGV